MNTNLPLVTAEAVEYALTHACELLRHNLTDFTTHFQDSNSQNNFYPQTENVEWTTGFCTGEYWLAYEHTADAAFRAAALTQVDSFLNRIEQKIDVNHHDMGFLYTPSCVAAYKLTGSETAKKAALLAADNLIARFQTKGQFLQAWGELGAKDNYRLIIDCLLNLPLLYWATEVTGDKTYAEIARKHTETSIANLVREDNSTYHTYFFDTETGKPLRGATQQGYRDGSAWARGQAWGVYGLALSYRYTKNPQCIVLFDRVTQFFIDHSPADAVAYWDMDFTDGSNEPKDSSATAIAVCGMLEMAKYLPTEKAAYYTDMAKRMAASLIANYAVTDEKQSNGLLLHGVYAKNSPYNPIKKDRGVDECNTWGDYFYMELLTRLSTDWNLYW
ncbi:MAG: glycoside hydrolase family 88 protein [Ruthenibacterium sp.]